MRLTTADTAPNSGPFKDSYLLKALLGWYVVIWVFLAIDPVDRQDWFLENMLGLGLMVLLLTTYRHFPLSDLSYIFITIFMTLHAIGAHYTYSKVSLGFWVQDMWALDRNHFDRLAHFSFRLLLAYPLRKCVYAGFMSVDSGPIIYPSAGFWRSVDFLRF